MDIVEFLNLEADRVYALAYKQCEERHQWWMDMCKPGAFPESLGETRDS